MDVGVPTAKFSIITAMMNAIPDIFVENVLSDLEFPDWFRFKCVSHRCQDIVLSNLKHLKKPEEIAVRLLWANNTKSLNFGYGKGGRVVSTTKTTTFVVSSSPANWPAKEDPADSWREGSVLFTKECDFIKVRRIGGDNMNVVTFLLEKHLPRMLLNTICAQQLGKTDFVMLSEILKTHAIIGGDLHVLVRAGMETDLEFDWYRGAAKLRGFQRSLGSNDILPILNNEVRISLTLCNVDIPRRFFDSPSLKSMVKFVNCCCELDFDDANLLDTLPHLEVLHITDESNVTATGLNTFLKQYLDGARSFRYLGLTLDHPNEAIRQDDLWTELVDGISWSDYSEVFHSADNERSIRMRFPRYDCDRSVIFYTGASCPYSWESPPQFF